MIQDCSKSSYDNYCNGRLPLSCAGDHGHLSTPPESLFMASATMPNASLFLAEAELEIKQVGNKFATGVENKATKGGYKT